MIFVRYYKNNKFFIKVEALGRKHNSTLSLLMFVDNPKLKLRLRDCLSLHARAFDPLGLILPLKMLGNLLFRVTLQHLSDQTKKKNSCVKPQNRLPWDDNIKQPKLIIISAHNSSYILYSQHNLLQIFNSPYKLLAMYSSLNKINTPHT